MTSIQDNTPFPVINEYNLYVPYEPYSASELSAMAYQGLLRPQFGPYYVDADQPDTPAQRAKSVKVVGDQLTIGAWTATLLTAAWIHLGGQVPELFEAATSGAKRSTNRSGLMPKVLRHANYLHGEDRNEDDLLVIGGVVVTRPAATIEDLLCIGATSRHQRVARHMIGLTDHDELRHRLTTRAQAPDSPFTCDFIDDFIGVSSDAVSVTKQRTICVDPNDGRRRKHRQPAARRS